MWAGLRENLIQNSGWRDLRWRRLWLRWAGIGLVLHFLGAVFSVGFYHADEHFQILEFMNHKLRGGSWVDPPIEFPLALRSWILPSLLLNFTRVLRALGIEDPFAWATAIRILSSLLGWIALQSISLASYSMLSQRGRERLLIFSAILWYLPSFHARTSAENWSGSVFFIALSWLLLSASRTPEGSRSDPGWLFALGGFGLGLAYTLRFQALFLAFGAVAWWVVIRRGRLSQLLTLLGSAAAAVGLEFLVDRWGYGRWTFPAWNYLRFTLIEGHVYEIGVGPWWDYFRLTLTEAWPGLGLILYLSWILATLRNPKSPWIWGALPLVLVHHIIAHKELRFLFPAAHAGPLFMTLALESLPVLSRLPRALKGAAYAYNGLALVLQSVAPASARAQLYSVIYHQKPQRTLFYLSHDDPFWVQGIPVYFYRPEGLRPQPAPPERELLAVPGPYLLYFQQGQAEPSAEFRRLRRCQVLYSQIPACLQDHWPRERLNNIKNWQLLDCQGLAAQQVQ